MHTVNSLMFAGIYVCLCFETKPMFAGINICGSAQVLLFIKVPKYLESRLKNTRGGGGGAHIDVKYIDWAILL